ncbi:hypothetical protein Agub_g14977, partial [Astrephomene gubernaculifera]
VDDAVVRNAGVSASGRGGGSVGEEDVGSNKGGGSGGDGGGGGGGDGTAAAEGESWRGSSHLGGPCAGVPSVTGSMVVADPRDGCQPPSNGAQLAGAVAVVVRGGCSFVRKTSNMQAAGAAAVLVINTQPPGELLSMAGDDSGLDPAIPALLLTRSDGLRLIRAINASVATAGTSASASAATATAAVSGTELPLPPLLGTLSLLPAHMTSRNGPAAAMAAALGGGVGGGEGTCSAEPGGGAAGAAAAAAGSGGAGGQTMTTRLDLLVPGGSQAFLESHLAAHGRTLQQVFGSMLADGRAAALLQQLAQRNVRQVAAAMQQSRQRGAQQGAVGVQAGGRP